MKATILIASILFCQYVFSQNADWIKQSPPLTTQSLEDIEILSPGVLVAVGGSGTIIKSTDGGETWAKKTSPTSSLLYSVNFVTPTVGYASGNSGTILKTTDGGETWASQSSGVSNSLYSIRFTSADTGWVSGYNRTILKTTDGGATWVSQYSASVLTYLEELAVINGQKVVAAGWGSAGEFYKTANGGQDWAASDLGTGWAKGVSFVDDTLGWVAGITASYISVTSDPFMGTSITVNGRKATLWKTGNGGQNWTPFIFNISQWLYDVTCVGSNRIFAVGENGLILYSLDKGLSWFVYGNAALSATSLYAVSFESTETGYIVGNYGTILKTTDGGLTWNLLTHGGTTNHLESICFINDSTGWAAGSSGAILKTTDGGKYWQVQKNGSTSSVNDVFFADANNGWCITSLTGKIYKTIDGGQTWTKHNSNTSESLYSIFFVNQTEGWAAGYHGAIVHTADGGITWNPQTTGISNWLSSIYFTNPSTGWACSYNKIIRTTNGGTTWEQQDLENPEGCIDLFFIGNTGWYVGGGIYKSLDGGLTWAQVFNNMEYYNYGSLNKVFFINSQAGWISTSLGKLLKTVDGGLTWGVQETGYGSDLSDLSFVSSETGWVVGYNGLIMKTSTGGGPTTPMIQLGSPVLVSPAASEYNVSQNPVLKWSYSGDFDKYEVLVVSSGDTLAFEQLTADSLAIENLQANTSYTWKVRIINEAGVFGNWATSSFRTCSPPDNYISLNYVYKYTFLDEQIITTLEWSEMWGIERYQVQVAEGPGFSGDIVIDTIVGTNSVDVLVNFTTKYYWRVAPINNCGSGGWTLADEFTTEGKPFIEVYMPSGGQNYLIGTQISIGWNDNIDNTLLILLYQENTLIDTIGVINDVYDSFFIFMINDSSLVGTNYTIVIKDAMSGLEGTSGKFSIKKPNINSIGPSAGTTVYRGAIDYYISWLDNTPNNLAVLLYKGGVLVDTICVTEDISQFSVFWNVSPSLATGNDYNIVVKDMVTGIYGTGPVFSIGNPSILIYGPAINTDWKIGSQDNQISWYYQVYRNLLLLLYKGGICIDTLGYTTDPYVTAFYWDIPADLPPGADYQIGFRDTLLGLISFTQDFSISYQTGNEILPQSDGMLVYPNPATSWVFVEINNPASEISRVSFINLAGQKIISKEITGTLTKLDISGIKPGVYLVRAEAGSHVFYHKKLVLK